MPGRPLVHDRGVGAHIDATRRPLLDEQPTLPRSPLISPAGHRVIWTRWDAVRRFFDEDTLVDLPAEHVLAHHAGDVAGRLRDLYGLSAPQDARIVADPEWQTWSILASLVERYRTPPIVVETHPCDGMYNCISLRADRASTLAAVDLNRGGGMHTHHPNGDWASPGTVEAS